MDIPVIILLALALIWLMSRELSVRTRFAAIRRGTPTLSAIILGSIVALDWFVGRQAILGHPGGLTHTVLKLVLAFLLAALVASGLTAIRRSRGVVTVLLNVAWCAGLIALDLKFLGAW
jgi:hypothetical protein